MHTLMVLGGGFVLLAACLFVARLIGKGRPAALAAGAKVFIPLWFTTAAVNMAVGVLQAGYTVAEEAPMFVLVFGVPAAAAAWLWRHFSRR